MIDNDYWSHNLPSGEEPWVFIVDAGYNYNATAENLAYEAPKTTWRLVAVAHGTAAEVATQQPQSTTPKK